MQGPKPIFLKIFLQYFIKAHTPIFFLNNSFYLLFKDTQANKNGFSMSILRMFNFPRTQKDFSKNFYFPIFPRIKTGFFKIILQGPNFLRTTTGFLRIFLQEPHPDYFKNIWFYFHFKDIQANKHGFLKSIFKDFLNSNQSNKLGMKRFLKDLLGYF